MYYFISGILADGPKTHLAIGQFQRVKEPLYSKIRINQIVVNGKPIVWCAQHDEITFFQAKARAYELPSFSGAESVGLLEILMDIENPSP